ncbi:MAG: magnesium transporter [Phycisphaeraceae bacterium]|nr:magnesium transporter [Phycisphaeraceae bacterium]
MIGHLVQSDLEDLIHRKAWDELREILAALPEQDVAEILIDLPEHDEGVIFRLLPRDRAAQVFSYLPLERQEELITSLSSEQTRDILNAMTPDDRVQLLDELPGEVTRRLMESLDPRQLKETRQLLNYPPDTAGHFMTPEFVAMRPDLTAQQAIDQLRRTPRTTETLNVLYVVDHAGRLLHDIRLATLVRASPDALVGDIVERNVVSIPAKIDREEVVRAFEKYDRVALPVVDDQGCMLGIITVDDVMDVARREATEDIYKIGGMEAIDTPYIRTPFVTLLRKRAFWLSFLFLGQMMTAGAMARFESEIAAAVALALFLPLIIASGGNSGSQASTLIVRALALSEISTREWWTVARREIASGAVMGLWLGFIGFLLVMLWQWLGLINYPEYAYLLGLTVWASLLGVVTYGTLCGSMLPFILRAFRLDPATSSAPFVATLVDVTGVVIYFSMAAIILRGTIL